MDMDALDGDLLLPLAWVLIKGFESTNGDARYRSDTNVRVRRRALHQHLSHEYPDHFLRRGRHRFFAGGRFFFLSILGSAR